MSADAITTLPARSAPLLPADIRARLAMLPRVRLACLPTPLHEAPRLAHHLGGPRIFIKRDDLTGAAFGGNKLRNLEFRMAAAQSLGADTIVVELDQQSNSARQTVAAANKLGMRTILVLQGAMPDDVQGNLLVSFLLGADVRFAADRTEQRQLAEAALRETEAADGTPCLLNDLPMFDEGSAFAYIESTLEILEDLSAEGLEPSCLYMSSSGKGQAGQLLARELLGADFQVRGITATAEFSDIPARTAAIANRAAHRLGLDIEIRPEMVDNDDAFIGPGYGLPSDAGNDAVQLFARTEGIVLDPIYTGKCAAGMIAHIRRGDFGPDDIVVFVHTGGTPAIFTHNALWTPQT